MVNGGSMWKKIGLEDGKKVVLQARRYSRTRSDDCPASPEIEKVVIRVSNHITYLGPPKEAPKPPQVLSLPPFPGGYPLAGRKPSATAKRHVTAISWLKYYFNDISPPLIQSHFSKGLVKMECRSSGDSSNIREGPTKSMKVIKHSEVMKKGAKIYAPITVVEGKINKRFDVIPRGTAYPNADEIQYMRRLVMYKDSAILVLNKPPKVPLKGNIPVHNAMDALAAAALTYDYDEGPKLVHRLDAESSGILLMGRTKESISYLHHLFGYTKEVKSLSKAWNSARDSMYQRYWALVIGRPKEREGLISAPLTKVMLDGGKTERVVLANNSGLEASQEAATEYRVIGPTINGCSWIELRPLTLRKHQLRVHCSEALGTPILGDYKYGWLAHSKWKQMPQVDYEPTTGKPYKLRRPEGLDVQKGSVLSRVPLLHLHYRELVLPNIKKFIELHKIASGNFSSDLEHGSDPDLLRLLAPMPTHMKISWNLMSSCLV